jgi:MFS family permease
VIVITRFFPAFKYKNYRIFFAGQSISLIGTWMQMVAQGYFVYQLTGSAYLVGLTAAIGQLPATAFSLVAGTFVDRFPKKYILQITNTLSFFLAGTLGLLIIFGKIDIISLTVFAFLMGLVNSVSQPARIAIVPELVEKEHIKAATAMNMAMFNSARIIGPAVAGWLILAFGVGWAYFLNGLSFLAPIISFSFIAFKPFVKKPHPGTLNAIKEGLSYAAHHKLIKYLLLYLGIISIFGWSYTTILPVIADTVFSQGASGLGLLFSAAGAGSVLGAIFISAASHKVNSKKLILFGGLFFGLNLLLFAQTQNFYLSLPLLFMAGFGLTAQNATIQSAIQHSVDDHIRGRVVSIQTLMLMGLHPVGSFQIGLIAEHMGSQFAVGVGAIVILISALLLFWKTPKHN